MREKGNEELGLLELANWVMTAPVGEARTVGIRADGNEVVTVKQYVNASVVTTTEMSLAEFRKFTGLTKRRTANGSETPTLDQEG